MSRLGRRLALLLGLLAVALVPPAPVHAHEPTMSVLDLTEVRAGIYLARWTVASSDGGDGLHPLFPRQCLWDPPRLDCGAEGLNGVIRFEEAGRKQSAMMVRITPLEGATQTTLLTANQAEARIRTTPRHGWRDWSELIGENLRLGVQHILQGPDHLLFVLGLVWLVTRTRGAGHAGRVALVKTVTAFTVAHSITLAVATFHLIRPPVAAVNASVALSILFLGPEMVRAARGETSLSLRKPQVVAFCFGLLHGFGFASALADAGLSGRELPYALLGFNLGVEIGQLAFILLLALLARAAGQVRFVLPAWSRLWPAYVVGGLGAFWTIGRTVILMGV